MALTRRRETRHVPPPSVVVEVHIMGKNSLNILRARDISLSGMGVRVPHGFSAHDLENELDLVVALPEIRSFRARGVVRHRNEDASGDFFGVEFTDLKPGNREEIRRFLDHLINLDSAAAPVRR